MNPCRFLFVGAALVGSVCVAQRPVVVAASPADPANSSHDTGILMLPGAAPKPAPPVAPPPPPIPPKAELPEGFKTESSVYLQKVIGIWKKRDAETLLGTPARTRIAHDEQKKANGNIYAWPDPTGRYRELELDFEAGSGTLRTVFAYPKEMTWAEAQKLWGGSVNTTPAQKGRMFYSYLDRKLDVLVDNGGKVISLGLY